MTAQALQRDPTDLEAQAERELAKEQRQIAAANAARNHLVWLLEEPMGRRELRRQLLVAKLDVHSPSVSDITDRHHGQMCANEAVRHEGLQLLWSLLRIALPDARLRDLLSKVFTETDE